MSCDPINGCGPETHNLHCGYPHCAKGKRDNQEPELIGPCGNSACVLTRRLRSIDREDAEREATRLQARIVELETQLQQAETHEIIEQARHHAAYDTLEAEFNTIRPWAVKAARAEIEAARHNMAWPIKLAYHRNYYMDRAKEPIAILRVCDEKSIADAAVAPEINE